MKVLVIGSGGREHAIAWKLIQSPKVTKLFAAPGNAGINQIAEEVKIKADDVEGLLKFASDNAIDFTVCGPEVPLELGIVDEFYKNGLKIFGPQKSAAKLEHSKIFAKEFMKQHNIPTAGFETFSSGKKEKALAYIKGSKYPLVIKADGLAAGKGVIICSNETEAIAAIEEIFGDKVFGSAGENIVVEDYLTGAEASVFAICDGTDYVVLPPAQDHKKIGEGETGKNTGGMGSYAPANKIVTEAVLDRTKKRIIEPVLAKMKSEGSEFRGVLYCGLMIDNKGDPYVIEFNTRFGDPETQVVLPMIESDLLELLIASTEGNIKEHELKVSADDYCCVVLASGGYPDKYETGKVITGLEKVTKDCLLFHAGTSLKDGKIVSSGGRVMNVVGKSDKGLRDAIDSAYANAELVNFENKVYRKDIGSKGL